MLARNFFFALRGPYKKKGYFYFRPRRKVPVLLQGVSEIPLSTETVGVPGFNNALEVGSVEERSVLFPSLSLPTGDKEISCELF